MLRFRIADVSGRPTLERRHEGAPLNSYSIEVGPNPNDRTYAKDEAFFPANVLLNHIARRLVVSSPGVNDATSLVVLQLINSISDEPLGREEIRDVVIALHTICKTFVEQRQIKSALSIWMRWLVLPSALSTFRDFHILPRYFETLLSTLKHCSGANHQKFCLAILKTSVAHLDQNLETPAINFVASRKEDSVKAITEYCSLFEIIVLGRYLNQIQECLALFPPHDSASLVKREWWVVLYASGMRIHNDTLQKCLGRWILQNFALQKDSMDEFSKDFLDTFFGWMSQGQLFFKSMSRDGRNVKSEHGDEVSAFCTRLARQNPRFSDWALSWLCSHIQTLNQHSTAYILQGLSKAPRTGNVADKAFALANGIHQSFSPFIRLVVRKHCLQLIEADLINTADGQANREREKHELQDQITASLDLLDGDTGPFVLLGKERDAGLSHLRSVTDTIFEKLSAKGYATKTENGSVILNWSHMNRFDPSQALWRLLARAWPYWIKESLRRGAAIEEISGNVAECIRHFFKISRRKTFLWKTSARNLRTFYLTMLPDVLRHPQVEASVLAFIKDPPSPKPEYLLDVAVSGAEVDSSGQRKYNITADETLGHAHIFGMLNQLRESDVPWGLALLDKILEPWLEDKSSSTVSKWKNTSQLQAVIILVARCVHSSTNLQKYYSIAMELLEKETNPKYRYLLEWLAIYVCRVDASLSSQYLHDILGRLEAADSSNPNARLVASQIRIAAQLVLHPRGEQITLAKHTEHLLSVLTAFMGSPRIPVRFEAQSSFPTLYEHAISSGLVKSMACMPVFKSVNRFVTGLDKWKVPLDARILGLFDAEQDTNSATLFEGGYLFISQVEAPLLYAKDLTEASKDINDQQSTNSSLTHGLPIGSVNSAAAPLIKKYKSTKPSIITESVLETTSAPLQTKSLAYDISSLTISQDTTVSTPDKHRGTGPILIGTLLESAINLGGLSRAANVFGAHSLHVPDLAIMQNGAFKNVSVDSELHLDVQETKPGDLQRMLKKLKTEGWSIVGLEQTSESKVIGVPREIHGHGHGHGQEVVETSTGTKQLPEKAVIIMGAEKTGIPADILFECDECIEIKQWGVTRSLNVQTAAACVLYEWRREWGDGKRQSQH